MKHSIFAATDWAGRRCLAALTVCITFAAAATAIAADAPKTADADASTAATEPLKEKGLTKLKPVAGTVAWVLDDETKVHEKLEAFRKADAAHRDAAKKAHTDSVTTAKDRDVLSKAEKRYQELKPYADKPDSIPP